MEWDTRLALCRLSEWFREERGERDEELLLHMLGTACLICVSVLPPSACVFQCSALSYALLSTSRRAVFVVVAVAVRRAGYGDTVLATLHREPPPLLLLLRRSVKLHATFRT